MWDETLIESRGIGRNGKKWVVLPLSMLFHGAVIAVIIGASYWFVEAIPSPAPDKIGVFIHEKPFTDEAPPPALGEKKPPKEESREEIPIQSEVPPVEVPELPEPIEMETIGHEGGSMIAGETGSGEGVSWGVDGGDPNSTAKLSGIGNSFPASDIPIVIRAEMRKPVLIHRVDPAYPEPARRLRIQGEVMLEAVINQSGSVENLQVIRSVHRLLDEAAVEAVRQWKYQPAMLKDRPVKVYFTVRVRFSLG